MKDKNNLFGNFDPTPVWCRSAIRLVLPTTATTIISPRGCGWPGTFRQRKDGPSRQRRHHVRAVQLRLHERLGQPARLCAPSPPARRLAYTNPTTGLPVITTGSPVPSKSVPSLTPGSPGRQTLAANWSANSPTTPLFFGCAGLRRWHRDASQWHHAATLRDRRHLAQHAQSLRHHVDRGPAAGYRQPISRSTWPTSETTAPSFLV